MRSVSQGVTSGNPLSKVRGPSATPVAKAVVAVGEDHLSIRALTVSDRGAAVTVINTGAEWYREFLGTDEIHQPEMTLDEWMTEARRMTWYGAFEGEELVAVMGLEYVEDVALIRHVYVLPRRQRQGVASRLYDHVERQIRRGVERAIVGTYAANHKARRAFESFGYRLSRDPKAILRRYYDIPQDRLQSSVTLEKRLHPDS